MGVSERTAIKCLHFLNQNSSSLSFHENLFITPYSALVLHSVLYSSRAIGPTAIIDNIRPVCP